MRWRWYRDFLLLTACDVWVDGLFLCDRQALPKCLSESVVLVRQSRVCAFGARAVASASNRPMLDAFGVTVVATSVRDKRCAPLMELGMIDAFVAWIGSLLSRILPPVLFRWRDAQGRSADLAVGHRAIMLLEEESRRSGTGARRMATNVDRSPVTPRSDRSVPLR